MPNDTANTLVAVAVGFLLVIFLTGVLSSDNFLETFSSRWGETLKLASCLLGIYVLKKGRDTRHPAFQD